MDKNVIYKRLFENKKFNYTDLKNHYSEKYRRGYQNNKQPFYAERANLNEAFKHLEKELEQQKKMLKESVEYHLKGSIRNIYKSACFIGKNYTKEQESNAERLKNELEPIHGRMQKAFDQLKDFERLQVFDRLPQKYKDVERWISVFCKKAEQEFTPLLQIGIVVVFAQLEACYRTKIEIEALHEHILDYNTNGWPEKNKAKKEYDNIPEYIERAIHKVASEISKKPNSHEYQKIFDSLELYHSTDLNGEEVAKEMNIRSNTFSTWKTKTDKEM